MKKTIKETTAVITQPLVHSCTISSASFLHGLIREAPWQTSLSKHGPGQELGSCWACHKEAANRTKKNLFCFFARIITDCANTLCMRGVQWSNKERMSGAAQAPNTLLSRLFVIAAWGVCITLLLIRCVHTLLPTHLKNKEVFRSV